MTTFPMNLELIKKLRALRARHLQRRAPHGLHDIEREHDAFLLDPGMGPSYYITSSGEVLADDGHFWGDEVGLYTPEEDEAIAALVVGSHKMMVAELLDLIPPPPPGAQSCVVCHGTRREHPHPRGYVCTACNGRGWADE